jgi:hypothetical protein
VKYQPDEVFLDVRAVVICCWPPGRGFTLFTNCLKRVLQNIRSTA